MGSKVQGSFKALEEFFDGNYSQANVALNVKSLAMSKDSIDVMVGFFSLADSYVALMKKTIPVVSKSIPFVGLANEIRTINNDLESGKKPDNQALLNIEASLISMASTGAAGIATLVGAPILASSIAIAGGALSLGLAFYALTQEDEDIPDFQTLAHDLILQTANFIQDIENDIAEAYDYFNADFTLSNDKAIDQAVDLLRLFVISESNLELSDSSTEEINQAIRALSSRDKGGSLEFFQALGKLLDIEVGSINNENDFIEEIISVHNEFLNNFDSEESYLDFKFNFINLSNKSYAQINDLIKDEAVSESVKYAAIEMNSFALNGGDLYEGFTTNDLDAQFEGTPYWEDRSKFLSLYLTARLNYSEIYTGVVEGIEGEVFFLDKETGKTAQNYYVLNHEATRVVFSADEGGYSTGGAGKDRLYGNIGQDTLIGGAGEDDLYGGEGNDYLISSTAETAEDGAADDLYGGAGNDVYALAGGDTASDTTGEDIYIVTSESANGEKIVIDDKDGKGKIWLNGEPQSYAVKDDNVANLWHSAPNSLSMSGSSLIITDHYGNEIEIKNFEDGDLGIKLGIDLSENPPTPVLFTNEDDEVEGTAGVDEFDALAGDDVVLGYSGEDILEGNDGHDLLRGGDDNDQLYAGTREDLDLINDPGREETQLGHDFLGGEGGDDLLVGSKDRNWINGGGNDTIYAGGGADHVMGDSEQVPYDLSDYANTGETKYDSVISGPNNPLDSGSDTIFAGDGDDVVWGQAGDDYIYGEAGDDALQGDLIGTLSNNLPAEYHGNDFIFGGEGNDGIMGEGGSDKLYGGQGNDFIRGDAPAYIFDAEYHEGDWLFGDSGEDTLLGQGGSDQLYGGADNDVLYGDHGDYSESNAGNDLLSGGAGDDQLFAEAGNDTLNGGTGVDYLEGGLGKDTYRFELGDSPVVQGVADNVVDTAGEGNQIVFGTGIQVDDVVLSVVGNDLFVAYHSEGIYITDGMKGSISTFIFESTGVELSFDQLFGSRYTSPRLEFGTGGDDLLLGGAAQNNLFGSGGNDTLVGGKGNSNLYGESGNDTLISQGGADLLNGGTGDDHYIVNMDSGAVVSIDDISGVDTLTLNSENTNEPVYLNEAGDDLIVISGDNQITIIDWASQPLETIILPDGTVLTGDDLNAAKNQPPEIDLPSSNIVATEDEEFTYTIPVIDEDTSNLTFELSSSDGNPIPSWVNFNTSTGQITGMPVNGDVGSAYLKITVTDGGGFSDTQNIVLKVQNINDAPVAVDDFVATESSAEVNKIFLSSDSYSFNPIKIAGGYLEFYPDLSSSGSGYNSLWARVSDEQYNEVRVLEISQDYPNFKIFKNDFDDIGVLTYKKDGYNGRLIETKLIHFNEEYTGINENILFNDPDSSLGGKVSSGPFTKVGFDYIGGDKGNEKFIFTNQNELETSVLLGGGSGEIQPLSEKLSFIADFSGGFATHQYRYDADFNQPDEAYIHDESGSILFSVSSEPGEKFIFFDRKSNGNYIAIEQSLENVQGNGNYTNWQYDLVEYDASGNLVKELALFPMGQVQEIHAFKLFDNDELHLIYDKGRLDYYVNEQSYLYESVVSSDLSSVSEVVVYDSKKWSTLGEIISWTDDKIDFTINYFGYWGGGLDSSDYGHYRISSDLTNRHIPDLAISPLDNDFDVDSYDYPYYSLPFVSAQVVSGYGSVSIEILDKVQTHGNPDRRLIYSTDGYYDYLPEGQTETVQIEYTIQDDAGAFSTATIEVQVNGVYVIDEGDLDPVIELETPNLYAIEDSNFEFIPEVSDEDPEGLTFELSSLDQTPLPAWIVFDPDTGSISGQPANGDVAVLHLKLTVTDSGGHSDTKNLILEVQNTNDAPVAVDDLIEPVLSDEVAFNNSFETTQSLESNLALGNLLDDTEFNYHLKNLGEKRIAFWEVVDRDGGVSEGWKYQEINSSGILVGEAKSLDLNGYQFVDVFEGDQELIVLSKEPLDNWSGYNKKLYGHRIDTYLEVTAPEYIMTSDWGNQVADALNVLYNNGTYDFIYRAGYPYDYGHASSNGSTVEITEIDQLHWTDFQISSSYLNDKIAYVGPSNYDGFVPVGFYDLNSKVTNNLVWLNHIIPGGDEVNGNNIAFVDDQNILLSKLVLNPYHQEENDTYLFILKVDHLLGEASDWQAIATFNNSQEVIGDVQVLELPNGELGYFAVYRESALEEGEYGFNNSIYGRLGLLSGEVIEDAIPLSDYGDEFEGDKYPEVTFTDGDIFISNILIKSSDTSSIDELSIYSSNFEFSQTALSLDEIYVDVLNNDYDPDEADTLSLIDASIISGLGNVTIQDGKILYTASSNYELLPEGEVAEVEILYTAMDDFGAESQAIAKILIPGGTDYSVPDKSYSSIFTSEGDFYLETGETDDFISIDASEGNSVVTVNSGAGDDLINIKNPLSSSTINLFGGAGSDKYVLSGVPGFKFAGVVTINDLLGVLGNSLEVGLPLDSSYPSLGLGSLKLTFEGIDTEIHLENFDPNDVLGGPRDIDTFIFNGVTFSYEELVALGFDLEGDAGDNVITGTSVVDRFYGGEGNDQLEGGEGDDVYFYNLGDGEDLIIDQAGNNKIVFGEGISTADLNFTMVENDLVIAIGDSGQITVQNWDLELDHTITEFETVEATLSASDVLELLPPPQNNDIIATEDSEFTYSLPSDLFSDLGAQSDIYLDAVLANGGTLPEWLSFDSQAWTFTGTPENDAVGELAILVIASNNLRESASHSFTLTVQNVNDAPEPVATLGDVFIDVDSDFSYTLPDDLFVDIDVDDQLTISVHSVDGTSLPEWLTFNPDTLTLEGTPTLNQIGEIVLSVTATDLSGAQVEIPLQLTVDDYDNLNEFQIDYSSLSTRQGTPDDDLVDGSNSDNLLIGGSGNDELVGKSGDDHLIGGRGNDFLNGGYGSDSYYFSQGFGHDMIKNYDSRSSSVDRIVFDSAITPDDVEVIRDSSHLVLRVGADEVKVLYHFKDQMTAPQLLDEVHFADGTVWTADAIGQMVLVASEEADYLSGYMADEVIDGLAGDDALRGNDGDDRLSGGLGNDDIRGGVGNDTLIGGEGNDYLKGDSGNDRYLFESGHGVDYIHNESDNIEDIDTVVFADTASDDLWFTSRWGRDLVINKSGTTDQVVIDDWYVDEKYRVDVIEASDATLEASQIDALVQAMASFDVPDGAGEVISQEVKDRLQPVLASTWQPPG